MPEVGVGGRAVWVGVEGGGDVDEGGGGGLVDVGGGTGVLLAMGIGEVGGGVVGGDVHVIVGEGVMVWVALVVPIAVVVGEGLAVDVPGVTEGVIEPVGVGDAVTVSAGCDAKVVDSAGWKGVGEGVFAARLLDVGNRPKTSRDSSPTTSSGRMACASAIDSWDNPLRLNSDRSVAGALQLSPARARASTATSNNKPGARLRRGFLFLGCFFKRKSMRSPPLPSI